MGASIGTLTATIDARTDPLEKGMKQAGRSLRGFAADAEAASNAAARAHGNAVNKIGIGNEVAKRSFGQVVSGVVLMTTSMKDVGPVGQAASNALGAFLAGGPISAGVSLLASGFNLLGKSVRDSAEEADRAAQKHIASIKEMQKASEDYEKSRHDAAVRAEALRQGKDPSNFAEDASRATDIDTRRKAIAGLEGGREAGTARIGMLRARLAGLDARPGTSGVGERQGMRDEIAEIETRLKQEQEQIAEHWKVIARIEADARQARATRAQAEDRTEKDRLLKAQEEFEERMAEVRRRAPAMREQGDREYESREGAKAAKELADALKQRMETTSREYETVQKIIDSEQRRLAITSDMLPYLELLQAREQAVANHQADQVAQLDSIIARKKEIAGATERQAKAEAALKAAQGEVSRAQDAARRVSEKSTEAPAPGAAPAGSGAAPGDTGPGRTLTGGGPGVWFEQQAMGPLAAARQAKKDARQQRKWKRHADNLAAERRESMSYGTIQDGGFDPFASDLGSVMDQYKPGGGKPKAGPMVFGSSMASDDQAAANQRMNEALDRQRDAALALQKAQEDTAAKSGEVAGKMGETAASAQEGATAMGETATVATALATAVAGTTDATRLVLDVLTGLKTQFDDLNAQLIQAAQIAGP